MLNRPFFSRSTKASDVLRRFWSLLLLVLVISITSSAFAVKMTATPFLVAEQAEAITTQAAKDARNLETTLERYRLLMSFVSNAPDVVDVVMGYVDNTDVVEQFVQSMELPENLLWLQLHDAFGAPLADFDAVKGKPYAISDAEVQRLIDSVLEGQPAFEKELGFHVQDHQAIIAFAVPVYFQNYTEGVIVAAFRLDLNKVFPTNDIAQRTFIAKSSDIRSGKIGIPDDASVEILETTDLSVVLVPDAASVQAAGQKLLTSTVSTLSLVLIISFALFAALGRAAIVEPHLRLENQKKSLSELAAVAKRANDAFLVTDANGRIVWTNPAFENLTGYRAKEAEGRKPGALLQGPETDPGSVAEIRNAMAMRIPIKTEVLNYKKTGEAYWVSLGISPLRNEQGEFYGFMAISHNVTQERAQRDAILAAKREIEHQALHDALTGLPNRRALDIALETRQKGDKANATIVRIDLDHFKYVNDTLGHAAGDFVLCEVADILRDETKSDDLPVRVGGDEFVILLSSGKTSQDGRVLAERMLERIKLPKQFEKKAIRVGASFGVASTLDGLLPMDQLIVGADAALYEAKDLGRNRVRIYTPYLHEAVRGRRALALEIRRAIANEEFVPYFQPQFDAKTREIVGVETLVRWDSPELGLMSPHAFLPIAQQLSAIDDIDALIFGQSLRHIKDLRNRGVNIPKVAFNVTATRIQNPDLFLDLPGRAETGFEIAFEVLESVLVEEQTDLFNFSVDRLREMGISIEIDDFGSGHASIIGLMHLRPDVMKIDQRLVLPVTRSETIRGLLKQIVGMANLMGLKVTAEGVETKEHADILTELGIDTLQGFYFAKPQSAEDLFKFAQAWQANSQEKKAGGLIAP